MIEPKDIEAVFKKQLDAIQDEKLRSNVVKTLVLACHRGNWESIEDLRDIPFTLLTETHGVNIIEHTIAVTEGAVGLGRVQSETYAKIPYKINFDRLYAGGLLHDVGKLVEYEPDGKGGYRMTRLGRYTRHPVSGAILARECGLTDDILNTIVCHAREGEGRPQVVEAVFIHQADFATFNPMVMKQKGTLIED